MRRTPLRKLLATVLLTIVFVATAFTPSARSANLVSGAKLFTANCSACHMGGSNVIIANKTLKKEALEKYSMNSLEAIRTQIIKGKNAMPAFGHRLSETQIEDVAFYVLGQAEKGW